MTPAQTATLANFIANDPVLGLLEHTSNNTGVMADLMNETATPAFKVWKTKLLEVDLESITSPEGTVWSWTSYIGRSQAERDAFRQMFNKMQVNPSLPQVRAGFADIFSGAAQAAQDQRAHCNAMSKRDANRVEKLFAVGIGSIASPATMVHEGLCTIQDVRDAWGMG